MAHCGHWMNTSRRSTQCKLPALQQAPQISSFSALTQYAFTMVLAGFAATFTVLPNICLMPALVAGFVFVLIMHSPGIVNLPFLTSAVASSVRASSTFEHSDFLWPVASASATAMPPFGRAFTLFFFIAFIAFMAFILVQS